MMTNFEKGKFSFIRLCAVIPLLVVMIFAFGAAQAESEDVVLNEEATLNVEPQTSLIEIKSDGKIFYNGKKVSTEELASILSNNKPGLVNIKAEPNVNMQMLYDVQSVLRQANVLRIKYSDANGNLSKTTYLPPVQSNAPDVIKIEEVTESRIPARNLFRVLINKTDKILCVYKQADNNILVTHSVEIPLHSMHILTGIIKEHFIGDAVTKGSADSEPVTYTLSDGRKVEYPMSEGIVSIEFDAQAKYQVYAEVDKAVKQAFYDLRLALAKDWFGVTKTLEDLSEDDLGIIQKAIPLKISIAEPRKITQNEEPGAMVATSNEQQAANRTKSEAKSPSAVGDIPYGVYVPHGFDTKWEFTKLSQEQMNDIWESLPSFTILSSDELKISFWRDVDYIKAGVYKYRVAGKRLYLSGDNGEKYEFPMTLEIIEGILHMTIDVDVKVCGVKLKEIYMSTALNSI